MTRTMTSIDAIRRDEEERLRATEEALARNLEAAAALKAAILHAIVDAGASIAFEDRLDHWTKRPLFPRVNGSYVHLEVGHKSATRWASVADGDIYAVIGGYGDKRRFPKGKNGVNVAKVAEAILEDVARRRREEESRKATAQAERDTAARIDVSSRYVITTIRGSRVSLRVTGLPPEEAKEVILLIRRLRGEDEG